MNNDYRLGTGFEKNQSNCVVKEEELQILGFTFERHFLDVFFGMISPLSPKTHTCTHARAQAQAHAHAPTHTRTLTY